MARATIKDIAEECGVSLSTVSLVLNNNPRISKKTREKVMAAVDRHGYQPNAHARGLASKSSGTISVVVPNLNHIFADIYFGELVSGIYDKAVEHNYKVMLDIANERFIETREYENLLKSKRVDAQLFIASSVKDEYLRDMEKIDHSFLLVNHYFPGSSLNYIAVDYKDSAFQAAKHLIELGHREIGLIAGTNTYTGRDFKNAFYEFCEAKGISGEHVHCYDNISKWSQEEGFEGARNLLQAHPEITAIMGANDRLAMGAMRYAHTADMSIPKDLSVMGVDDIPAARFATPGLSTIQHQLYKLGQMAYDQALALFRDDITSSAETLPVKLIERESTGRPPRR